MLFISSDTDVAILLLSLGGTISVEALHLRSGMKKSKRILDNKTIRSALSAKLCDALIGLQVYTGCDTVSAFLRKN